jgi:hypothetical protein
MKSDAEKLLKKNEQLNHLELVKVVSHVQREVDGGTWVSNSLMLEAYDVPFKYRRKQRYRSLQGARVNVTYYPQIEKIAGMNIEVMKVVRIRQS